MCIGLVMCKAHVHFPVLYISEIAHGGQCTTASQCETISAVCEGTPSVCTCSNDDFLADGRCSPSK